MAGYDTAFPFRSEHFMLYFSLYNDKLWVPVLIAIYWVSTKKQHFLYKAEKLYKGTQGL